MTPTTARALLRRPWVAHACWAAGYTAAAVLGKALRLPGVELSLVWPAAGVVLLWLARTPGRRGSALVLSAVLASSVALGLLTGSSALTAVVLAATATLSAAVSAAVVARWAGGWRLRSPRDLAALLAGCLAGPLVTAPLGPVVSAVVHGAPPLPAAAAYVARLGVGAFVVVVLGLLLRRDGRGAAPALASRGEAAALLVATAGGYGAVFWAQSGLALCYALFPVAVWVGLRLSTRGAAAHLLAVSAVVLLSTFADHGPFAGPSVLVRLLLAHTFLGVVGAVTLLLALHRDERVALEARVEAALAAAQEQAALLRAVHDATQDGIAVFSATGSCLLRNPVADRLLGDNPDRDQPNSWEGRYGFTHPDGTDVAPADLPVVRALGGESVTGMDLVVYGPATPDGRLFSVSAAPLPATPGAAWAGGVVAAFTDVSDERASAAEVTRGRDRLAAVLDGATEQAIIGVDAEGLITVFSAGAERLTGWAAADALGRTPQFLHDADEVAARAAELGVEPGMHVVTGAARTQRHETRTWTFVTRDGARKRVSLTITAMRGGGGEVEGFIGVATDTTAQLDAERRLADSEQLFRLAFETAPLGLAVVCLSPGTEGLLRRTNAAFLDISGATPDDVDHRRLADLLHPDDRGAHGAALALLASGTHAAEPVERRFLRPDGTVRWGRASVTTIHPSDGADPYLLVLVEDVTARRAAQLQLTRMALHDALTGLPNRVLLTDRLEQALAAGARAGRGPSLLYIDLDGFKAVNDAHGHAAGDALLVEVARRLEGVVRGGDTVARLGGDEFAVVCPCDGPEPAGGAGSGAGGRPEDCARAGLEVARRVLAAVAEPFVLPGGALARVGASIGIATADGDQDAAQLLSDADRAMYEAKRSGKHRAAVAPSAVGATLAV